MTTPKSVLHLKFLIPYKAKKDYLNEDLTTQYNIGSKAYNSF